MPFCKGKRLRSVICENKFKTVSELVDLPIKHLSLFFKNLELDEYEKQIAKRLLVEINNRLSFDRGRIRLLDFKQKPASLSGENHNELI
jgi:excinuclease ABC subunit A